jgi:hypothetical protein
VTSIRRARPFLLLAAALGLASGAGYLTSTAISAGTQAPARTVTINVGTGTQGPPGPAGPAGPKGDPGPQGPSGALACPAGYDPGRLVINHPSGQVAIWTCLATP